MQANFNYLTGNDKLSVEDYVVPASQLIKELIESFEPRSNDLKFTSNNVLLKRICKKITLHGTFNRLEWRFAPITGIKCQCLSWGDKTWQEGHLRIKVTLDFLTLGRRQVSIATADEQSHKQASENFEIRALLEFCPQD